MLELEVSPEAENDLLEIWLYIAEDQPTNADHTYTFDKIHTGRRLIDIHETEFLSEP